MTRKRHTRRRHEAQEAAARPRPDPRLPGLLEAKLADIALELARQELRSRKWRSAYRFAEAARATNPEVAEAIMGEASAREARRSALKGDFAAAEAYALKQVAEDLLSRQPLRLGHRGDSARRTDGTAR